MLLAGLHQHQAPTYQAWRVGSAMACAYFPCRRFDRQNAAIQPWYCRNRRDCIALLCQGVSQKGACTTDGFELGARSQALVSWIRTTCH